MVHTPDVDWTDADQLETLVGTSSNLDKFTADKPLRLVRSMFDASVNLHRTMIEVRGTEVILHLSPEKREPVLQEMRDAGLLDQITIPCDVIASSDRTATATRKSTQGLLFSDIEEANA